MAPPSKTPPLPLDSRLRNYLQALPFDEIGAAWEYIIAEHKANGARWLGRNDRYFLLCVLLKRPDAKHPWLYARCREVESGPDDRLDLWAREHYKLQRLDEPTPTPYGWKLHGDLEPGDELFGPDGKICHVVALNKIVEDAECYEIEFDDGSKVSAGSEHLWPVERRTRKRIPMAYNADGPKRLYRETVLMQTREIAAHKHRPDSRLAIRINGPLDLPTAALPIDPYVLGVWLGDGDTNACGITGADPEVFDEIERRGYAMGNTFTKPDNKAITRNILGFGAMKRAAGLDGTKFIPAAYLRASIAQRIDLLQGLMDTDGHCDTRGTATFVNTNDALVEGFVELCHTLGLKPRQRKVAGKHNGDLYPYWQVSFQGYKALPPFKLLRKLARCKDGVRTNARRYIVGCHRVACVPMRCIQVDRRDGLYLTSRSMVTTHNSTIITFAGIIQEIVKDPEITVGIFSHTKPIARKFLLQIKTELETNRVLIETYPDVFYADPKRESTKWSEEKGIVVKRKGNPKEATIEAWGLVDGQPTASHFLLRVYDDVVTKESVSTPDQVTKTTGSWELSDNLGAAGEDGKSRRWHIGTRYSFADTYQVIMERKVLKERIYPATDDGTIDGNPVFLSSEVWEEKKRTQGLATIAAQMLQNPSAGAMAMFKKEWLRFVDIRPATLNVYILVDPASSRKKGSDRTAMAVIGIDSARNKYLLDGYHHRMSLSERWMAMSGLRKVWMNMPGVQMVKVGYERYGSTSDLEYFEEKMDRAKDEWEIHELAWPRDGTESKYDRIQRLEPDFRAGQFYLAAVSPKGPDGKPSLTKNQQRVIDQGQKWRVFTPTRRVDETKTVYSLNKTLLDEYLVYPFAVHDDFLDACSRIYDIDPVCPIIIDENLLEPETFID